METGKIIVIEGACDGMGKSTQFSLLHERLEKNGNEVVNHHFPSYNTFHGEPVVRYLKGELGDPAHLSPYMVNSLYAVDRACAWNSKLKLMYEDGKILLFDRYTTSSLIYQAAQIKDIEERKKFLDYVCDYEYNKLGIGRPDNVIFLYAPFDMITEMRKNRKQNDGIENDLHERDIEFMREAYENAMFVAEYLSWDMVQCNDGDKLRTREDIHEEVCRLVRKKTL